MVVDEVDVLVGQRSPRLEGLDELRGDADPQQVGRRLVEDPHIALGGGAGRARRHQRHVVAAGDELIDESGDDRLGAAVRGWRDPVPRRRHHADAQRNRGESAFGLERHAGSSWPRPTTLAGDAHRRGPLASIHTTVGF